MLLGDGTLLEHRLERSGDEPARRSPRHFLDFSSHSLRGHQHTKHKQENQQREDRRRTSNRRDRSRGSLAPDHGILMHGKHGPMRERRGSVPLASRDRRSRGREMQICTELEKKERNLLHLSFSFSSGEHNRLNFL